MGPSAFGCTDTADRFAAHLPTRLGPRAIRWPTAACSCCVSRAGAPLSARSVIKYAGFWLQTWWNAVDTGLSIRCICNQMRSIFYGFKIARQHCCLVPFYALRCRPSRALIINTVRCSDSRRVPHRNTVLPSSNKAIWIGSEFGEWKELVAAVIYFVSVNFSVWVRLGRLRWGQSASMLRLG